MIVYVHYNICIYCSEKALKRVRGHADSCHSTSDNCMLLILKAGICLYYWYDIHQAELQLDRFPEHLPHRPNYRHTLQFRCLLRVDPYLDILPTTKYKSTFKWTSYNQGCLV